MFVRRSLVVLALTLAVVRCTDQPTALQQSPRVPQFVRWARNVAPQFTAISGAQSNQHGRPGFRTPPLSLNTYSVSFWAVRGESRSVQINYASAIDTLTHPFMQLTITDPTIVPGQGALAVGDSVLVTVNIDTTKIGISLEPTIEHQLLGLAYRESSTDPWWRVPVAQSFDDHSFTSALPHFSDYAIDLDVTLLDWTVSW